MKALRELVAGRTWHIEDLRQLADVAQLRPETRELGDVLAALLDGHTSEVLTAQQEARKVRVNQRYTQRRMRELEQYVRNALAATPEKKHILSELRELDSSLRGD